MNSTPSAIHARRLLPSGAEAAGPIPPDPGTRIPGSTKFQTEKQNRDSTVVHGLRSGALAGVITGTVCGLTCSFFGGMLASGMMADTMGQIAAAGKAGLIIFTVIFIIHVIFATIVGAILGGMNVLCYQADCIKFGAIAGAIVGIILLLLGMNSLTNVLGNATDGAIIGYLASYIERSWFRKQYAEL